MSSSVSASSSPPSSSVAEIVPSRSSRRRCGGGGREGWLCLEGVVYVTVVLGVVVWMLRLEGVVRRFVADGLLGRVGVEGREDRDWTARV